MSSFKWTEDKIEFLKKVAPNTLTEKIKEELNAKYNAELTLSAVRSAMKKFNVKNGLSTRDKSGVKKMRKLNVRKPSSIPIGAIRYRSAYKVLMIKTEKENGEIKWEQYHRYIWKKHHGEIPEDHVIIFADGNIENVKIENLLCITKSELMKLTLNDMIDKNAELTRTNLNIIKLENKIRDLKK